MLRSAPSSHRRAYLKALPDFEDVLAEPVKRAVEPPVALGPARERLREAVDERQAELVGQTTELAMSAVDELPTLLGGLVRVEEAAKR